MRRLTVCKRSVSLSFLNWIKYEMIFCRISEFMSATLIQRYDKKNHFISRMRDFLKLYMLSGAKVYDCINTTYQFIEPFLDNTMSLFEE